MFRQNINATAMTSEGANMFFGDRIIGDTYGSDVSLLSTIRALAWPRFTAATDHILIRINDTFGTDNITAENADESIRSALNDYNLNSCRDNFIVHGFRGGKEISASWISALKDRFARLYPGYEPIEKITAFYQKSFDVLCFVNRERRVSVMLVGSLDLRKLHYLQCAVLPAMPWYYDHKKGLTEEETTLVRSFNEQSADAYIASIARLAEQYDFRTAMIRAQLDGIETRFAREELVDLSNQIQSLEREVTQLYDKIGDRCATIESYRLRLLGLENAVNSGEGRESELTDFFLHSAGTLVLDSVNDSCINFSVITDLSMFDEDQAERAIKNDRSLLYMQNGVDRSVPRDDMRLLMRAIFLDHTLTVRFCGSYLMDLARKKVNGRGNNSFTDPLFANAMPNPHIQNFSCTGENGRTAMRMLNSHNYIGAINQCVMSAGNLNFGDSTVLNRFIGTVCDAITHENGKKCVRLGDGSYVTFAEALAFLKNGGTAHE